MPAASWPTFATALASFGSFTLQLVLSLGMVTTYPVPRALATSTATTLRIKVSTG